MFKKLVVIDGANHLVGRLASIIAKELLGGQRIVVVRCEKLVIAGHLFRNKLRYLEFLRKRMATNPKRGPFHERSPAAILKRTVRGMLPYKTRRGAEALERLQCYEGIPAKYQKAKRLVAQDALKSMKLRPGQKVTVLGELSKQVGWKYADVVEKLEEKRKKVAKIWYAGKVRRMNLEKIAKKNLEQNDQYKKLSEELAKYGY